MHCDAARRRQALGWDRSVDPSTSARAPGPNSFVKKTPPTTPLACASVQSPQAQAGPRRGPERRSSIRCRSLRCEHPLPRSKRVQPSTNRSLKMRTVPCSVSVGTVPLAFSRPYCSIECQREAPETKMRDSNPGLSVESVRPSRWTKKTMRDMRPIYNIRMGFLFRFNLI